jgi:signal transduction histidine kinase
VTLGPVDVAGAVRDVQALSAGLAAEAGVSVLAAVPPSAVAWTDADRIEQVLLNLLSNAVKYNRPGGSVEVRVEAGAEAVRVTVADTGRGIDPDDLARAFDPFERLGAERTAVPGTGLGLAIVASVARALSVRIDIDSTPGVGTTVVLRIPTSAPRPRDERPAMPGRARGGT